jgi:hypothetical protein
MTVTSPDVRFDVAGLVASAVAAAGGSDDELAFLDALGVLADALDTQANLTPAGRVAVRGALVGALSVQLRLAAARARHPELAATPVDRPVFLTGLLRSGTTLVHNLLALHPGLRAPALWELMSPVGERADAAEYERLADAAQAYVTEYYRVAPDLPTIHFLDARRPDECHRLTGNAFTTMVYEMRYRVPAYADWLAAQDHTPAYRFHRAQLQAILWRRPGGPAVLKDPFHLWQLPALVGAYPDARVVQLHRDPAQTVPSTCSLCVAVRVARSGVIDRAEIGRQWLGRIEAALSALPAVRAGLAISTLDVRYHDLVADPMGTLGRICEFIGVPLTTDAESAMRAYLDRNTATTHGVHRYAAADFGLDEADLRRRFAGYCHEYGV